MRQTDLDPLGLLGPRREHRPALEVFAIRLAVQGVEVVPVEDDVDPGVLGGTNRVAQVLVVGVLGVELDSDADGARHGGPFVRCMPATSRMSEELFW